MILLAIGANLTGPWGSPAETAAKAVRALNSGGISVTRTSRTYRTAAVGPGRQEPYVNLVVEVETHLPPAALLMVLHRIEAFAGRRRRGRWRARTLDIDLIAYHHLVLGWSRDCAQTPMGGALPQLGTLVVPHPRLHLRPFVVRPLADIAPLWHHPVTGQSAQSLWLGLQRQREGRVLRIEKTVK